VQSETRQAEWGLIERWCEFIGLNVNEICTVKMKKEFLKIVMGE
jgi:hypothetical protein